jgi:hypothetical protein
MLKLPVYYTSDVCGACGLSLKADHDGYRAGDREYHADCFDLSLFIATPPSAVPVRRTD